MRGVSSDPGVGDLVEEDRRKLEQTFVHAPGGTVAPRAWSGWNAGKEFEARRRKRSEEEVSRGSL